ncbi:alpha-1,6-mannosyl-glycoprotein 2-beta-N-acetylglucosaminyltransferase-like [Leguminivora glycinivorella]|uniref:alpha-1,6-mannosyl-glycoprotein 2-beta-N-acetylglucosaminyltransferase-like n=1 Tax=Leguminivora glycinivorella TaxID=1035111 RepID=UPI00200FD451|nr:alpha-1,6-mannosyl-glycoprotein 2-beta-N-acetylglucosaminyltransferase-like [Leguminivora glycinivorella]
MEAEDMDEDSMLHKFRKTYSMEDKIADMSKMIKHINEKQRIRNARKLGLKESYFETVLVVKSEQYLTSDFIHMAKMLEKLQTLFCPECRLLSLASHPPRPEQYTQNNNTLVVDAWGPTFSSSAIGFNRRTWYEIKYRKQEFCSFNDSSWDNSLRYLVSTTQEQKFLMLSPEGPRAFSTKGCGELNGTECSLDRIFLDILEFLPTIEEGLFPEYFKLKVGEAELNGTIEGVVSGKMLEIKNSVCTSLIEPVSPY